MAQKLPEAEWGVKDQLPVTDREAAPREIGTLATRLGFRRDYGYLWRMEELVSKRRLADEQIPLLITDKQRALETFGEILERGRSFYPEYDAARQFPRIYRIISLAQS